MEGGKGERAIDVIFLLFQLGSTNSSYALQTAKLAGLPLTVTERAKVSMLLQITQSVYSVACTCILTIF